ncbi:MAG: glucose-6-phosphate dehydrogenase [Desulfobulbaceae bacterium]|nr:glucose-6-phosphate dehydrogenase [Desulfobulbaceae bacterium]
MTLHACDRESRNTIDPCTIVIFGASGDLTRRKLIPALFSLFEQGKMPLPFTIVGCGRTELDDEQFRHQLHDNITDREVDRRQWDRFAKNLHYKAIAYDLADFKSLAALLDKLDREKKTGGNRIFDLAVPPSLYPVIAELLGLSGLSGKQREESGWARIVVEKPFGTDVKTAIKLDSVLHRHFREEQIFRIDHYLAKETVQNTLIFRFANSIFEPLWNRHHIDYIGIVAAEELGVGSRAGYYDESGVLRDMFQNHMMQLLVLTAMEPPWCYEADAVQDEKAKVIRSLREFSMEKGSRICLGQYSSGKHMGKTVPGYREEQGVKKYSLTPTFALLELYIDNWRWQDVPFYLISGKRLPRKETRIVIQFKEVPHRLFRDVLGNNIGANRLVIETFPEEAIRLNFQTKNPGREMCLRSMTMDFVYNKHYTKASLDAYARVLLDCMAGDHMLFWRQDGIELSWAFLNPVLEECDKCEVLDRNLNFYPAGTWGPEPAMKTMQLLIDG